MPRERTGTIERSEKRLRIRITVQDADGKSHRPWIDLDPKMTDVAARKVAKKVSAETAGKPWDAKAFERKRKHKLSDLVTCDEYVEKIWLPARAAKLRSVRSDRYRYRLHVSPVIGSLPLDEVTPETLRDLVEALDEKAADDSHRFGAKTAKNVWALVSKMFDDAVSSKRADLRLLTVNPATGVKPPDPPGEVEKQWLFPSELRQLLSYRAVPLERRRIYAAAVYCYTRPGETLAFLWGRSIDLKHGMVRVNRSYDHVEKRFIEHTKTGDSRHFAIEPILMPMFEAMRRDGGRQGLLFPTLGHLAENLRKDLMTAGVTRASLHVRRRGALRMRFHDLRATGITYMAIRGDKDNDVRERAGHADFETTLVYIRRGHLSSGTIGDPYAALPAELLESSRQSSGNGGSSPENESDSDVYEEREKGFEFSQQSPTDAGGRTDTENSGSSSGEKRTGATGDDGWDDSGDDSDPSRGTGLLGLERVFSELRALHQYNPRLAAPGLAVVRGLDAATRLNSGDETARADLAAAGADWTTAMEARS